MTTSALKQLKSSRQECTPFVSKEEKQSN